MVITPFLQFAGADQETVDEDFAAFALEHADLLHSPIGV
jgi:hypothetical protein